MTAGRELPLPAASRLRRPGWAEPRLLIGLVIVAGSVALGSWVVASADRTVAVYAARDVLVPGQVVAADQLMTVRARIVGDSAAGYLRADEPLPADVVAVRVVEGGELVPRSALATAGALELRPVPVPAGAVVPSDLGVGSAVDLWFTPSSRAVGAGGAPAGGAPAGGAPAGGAPAGGAAAAGGVTTTPHPIATGLTVAEVGRPGSGFGASSGTVVHVLVPVPQLADVLGALGADGEVTVVLVPAGEGTG